MRTLAVMAAIVLVVGSAFALRAEGEATKVEFPKQLRIDDRVFGPVTVKEVTVHWTDREEPSVYRDDVRLTVFDEWVRIDEQTRATLRDYDTSIMPRVRVKEMRIEY